MAVVFYTTSEAAQYIGCSQSTINNYIRRGLLKADVTYPSSNGKSGRRKFKQETLDNFIKTIEGDAK